MPIDDCWECIFDFLDTRCLLGLAQLSRHFQPLVSSFVERRAAKNIRSFRRKINSGVQSHRTWEGATDALYRNEYSWRGRSAHVHIDMASCYWEAIHLDNRRPLIFSRHLDKRADIVDAVVILGVNIRTVRWSIKTGQSGNEWAVSHHLGGRFALSKLSEPLPLVSCFWHDVVLEVHAESVSAAYVRYVFIADASTRRCLYREDYSFQPSRCLFRFSGGFVESTRADVESLTSGL